MSNLQQHETPEHIPDHLVYYWDPMAPPGADYDPHTANAFLQDGPEVFFSPSRDMASEQGAWIVTRVELIREIFQNPVHFSSKSIAGFSRLLGEDWDLIPLEKDPPEHAQYRMILNPLFAPKRITELNEAIRRNAISLIDELIAEDSFDFVPRFGQQFPISVIMNLIGLNLDDLPTWVNWGKGLLHGKTIEEQAGAAANIKDYLIKEVRARRESPCDDIMSTVVNSEVNGHKMTEIEALGAMYLLFVGGLDTVASTLGFMFRHLSAHPELQNRLRAEPEKISDALEEIMRAHGIVNSPRIVTEDLEFHGISMKKNDRVLLAQTLSCRDPRAYDRPNEIDIDRKDGQHMIFATGPHRCLGSHLARREMLIALEEWFARAPKFMPAPEKKALAQAGGVWGMNSLPLVWDR